MITPEQLARIAQLVDDETTPEQIAAWLPTQEAHLIANAPDWAIAHWYVEDVLDEQIITYIGPAGDAGARPERR